VLPAPALLAPLQSYRSTIPGLCAANVLVLPQPTESNTHAPLPASTTAEMVPAVLVLEAMSWGPACWALFTEIVPPVA
jgi:hypothetical protein